MTIEELEKAERDDPQLAIAHLIRNDLSGMRLILQEIRDKIDQALQNVKCTMDGLQGLLNTARADAMKKDEVEQIYQHEGKKERED